MLGHHDEQRGIFGGASPQLTFLFGLVLGLAIVSIAGFLLLLFTGGSLKIGNGATAQQIVTPPAPPSDDPNAPIRVGPYPAVSADDHVRGSPGAEVTLIEYSDTECPFCKQFHGTMKDILAKYDGRVRWVYRNFPIPSLHSKAPKEAEALECAAELGGNDKFWAYTDRIYSITPSNDGLDLAELPKIAVAVGLNEKKFTDCLASGKYAEKVSRQANDAVTAGQYIPRGVGTPFTILVANDGTAVPIPGAYPLAEVEQIVNQFLQ